MGSQVHMLKPSIFPAITLLAILTACSNTPAPTTAKQEPEKVEPATGQTAVFRMYQMARAWAPDCEIMKLESMRLSDVKEAARLIGGRSLIVAPLAVCHQTVREAAKLGIDVRYVRSATEAAGPGIWITNTEMALKFD